jgi:hypothetical protein
MKCWNNALRLCGVRDAAAIENTAMPPYRYYEPRQNGSRYGLDAREHPGERRFEHRDGIARSSLEGVLLLLLDPQQ